MLLSRVLNLYRYGIHSKYLLRTCLSTFVALAWIFWQFIKLLSNHTISVILNSHFLVLQPLATIIRSKICSTVRRQVRFATAFSLFKRQCSKGEGRLILYLPIQMYIHPFNITDQVLTVVCFMWLSLLIFMGLLFTPTNTNHVYLFVFLTVYRQPSDVIY